MNKNKRARLEARGWRVGNAAQFLELSAEEAALVETKLLLSALFTLGATPRDVASAIRKARPAA
ncbi:MAG TPA: hypothetical protein VGK32_17185 [Vicinamibacterales bacterium]|jgi:hypothetical protein